MRLITSSLLTKSDVIRFLSINYGCKLLNCKSFVSKLFLFSTFTLLLLSSCSKESTEPSLPKNGLLTTIGITDRTEVNESTIKSEALQYYKNIATMARWYVNHPNVVKQYRLKGLSSEPDSVNTLLAKLEEIVIKDTLNVQISIFDLEPAHLDTFLNSFVVIEANELSKKLSVVDTSTQLSGAVIEMNNVFKETFNSQKSAELSPEDPFWKIRRNMVKTENIKKEKSKKVNTLKSAESDFWARCISNGILATLPVHLLPTRLAPQTFINRIQQSIRPGRLLIALPGGFTTTWPMVVYLNLDYDFGHVAVFNNNNQFNDVIKYPIFTIGTNSEANMHNEILDKDWCQIHGVAFVGQVFDVSWTYSWSWRRGLRIYREQRDVNNDAIYNQASWTIGREYCNPWEMLFAKVYAPEKLMCSSAAWYFAKKGCNVNIGDWWKPSIFPAGVYLSDRVRIVDNTIL